MEFLSATERKSHKLVPRLKEIWYCDHGNSNVQEEQEGYVHRETHCGQDMETMVNLRWKGERQRECRR